MKRIFVTLGLLAAAAVYATDYPQAWSWNTQTNQLISNNTNATGSTIQAEFPLYHTFQAVNSGTNTATISVDWSLDASNWTALYTNTLLAGTSSGTTTAGKFTYLRARMWTTNSATVVNYLGGR